MGSLSPEYEVIEVHPADHEVLPEETRHNFSNYDMFAPARFTKPILFFALPDERSKVNIVSSIKSGLSRTLQQFPFYAGKLQWESQTQRPYVLQKRTDTVLLAIRHLDEKSSIFPSLSQWYKADYPDEALLKYKQLLCPPNADIPDGSDPWRGRMEPGCPMSIFQINFIPGGIILMPAFHHYAGDLSANDLFCTAWAKNSATFAGKRVELSNLQPSYDRTYCSVPDKVITSDERIAELIQRHSAFKVQNKNAQPEPAATSATSGSATPEASKQAKLITRTMHFSNKNCHRLKQLASPAEPGNYVSTYDCLVAIVWRAITRARAATRTNWNTSTQHTRLLSAVNMRYHSKLPLNYAGNAFAAAVTDPIMVDDLLAQPLSAAALMTRKSILRITPSHIPEVLELAKATRERSQILALDVKSHLDSDLNATSWAQMEAYDYDFGFGFPTGFRSYAIACDGLVKVYPRNTRRGDDEGFEVAVTLVDTDFQQLLQDRELWEYAELRSKPL